MVQIIGIVVQNLLKQIKIIYEKKEIYLLQLEIVKNLRVRLIIIHETL